MNNFDFSTYISPFTWRYGSEEMRIIFSEKHKYELWRKIWIALAKIQYQYGLVSKAELNDLVKNQNKIDIERIFEIEKETKHDVVAAIKEFAEKAKIGGGKIHMGATSMDITDNAEILKIKESLLIVDKKLGLVLKTLGKLIKKYADFPCIGYTHLQPAEPTTVGYRLSFYAQELLLDLTQIKSLLKTIKGKGFKGAVGTSASYQLLLKSKKITAEKFEEKVMRMLGLNSVLISGQTYPRSFDFIVLNSLANLNSSLAKFAGDLRILQSPNFGEWSESFGQNQVGSSAMPFKKNPINSENICSLARYVASLPNVARENATLSYLERTLDDSANRRVIIAEGFLATDQILTTANNIFNGLIINEKRITHNLDMYAPFAVIEIILMETVKRGANRQKMHELLRGISLTAWQKIQTGETNPIKNLLINDNEISKFLTKKEIIKLLDVKKYVGNAPLKALKLVGIINKIK